MPHSHDITDGVPWTYKCAICLSWIVNGASPTATATPTPLVLSPRSGVER